jgi:hypothetical protein
LYIYSFRYIIYGTFFYIGKKPMMMQGDIRSFRGWNVSDALRALDDEGPSLEDMLSDEAVITRYYALKELSEEVSGWSNEQLEREALRLEASPYSERLLPGLQRGDRLNAIYDAMQIKGLL